MNKNSGQDIESFKKVLEEKYGSIRIDLLTGKWKRVNDKEDV